MKKSLAIAIGVVGLLLGIAVGVNTNRYFTHQHEKTTAVMVLLQLHLDAWEKAVPVKSCKGMDNEVHSLQFLAGQIPVVLPLADQQDVVFHRHILRLQQVLLSPAVVQCAAGMAAVKQVRDACDECHRDYR